MPNLTHPDCVKKAINKVVDLNETLSQDVISRVSLEYSKLIKLANHKNFRKFEKLRSKVADFENIISNWVRERVTNDFKKQMKIEKSSLVVFNE